MKKLRNRRAVSTEDYVYSITCPKCGYIWTPEPFRWRNVNNTLKTGVKVIYCPSCNKRLVISKDEVTYLLTGKVPEKILRRDRRARPPRVRLKRHGRKSNQKARAKAHT